MDDVVTNVLLPLLVAGGLAFMAWAWWANATTRNREASREMGSISSFLTRGRIAPQDGQDGDPETGLEKFNRYVGTLLWSVGALTFLLVAVVGLVGVVVR